jgi:hypothetical protein
MAAAWTNLIMGVLQLGATIAMWIATAVVSIVSCGIAAAPFIALGIMMSATIGVTGAIQLAHGIEEMCKKDKIFKLFAIRGNDTLLLPPLGHQSKLNKFVAQARYEIETYESDTGFADVEKLIYFLGSRVYAKKYFKKTEVDWYKKPSFIDSEENSNYTLTIIATNIDHICGGYSISKLKQIFEEIFGIITNNFDIKDISPVTFEYEFNCPVDNF